VTEADTLLAPSAAMELPDFHVTPENRELLADYGETMLQVQLFEFELLSLVNAQTEERESKLSEHLWRMESLFASTAGQLRRRARIEDPELGGLLENTVVLRNRLVHHWLIFAGLSVRFGRTDLEKERENLRVAARSIQVVRERLQELFDDLLKTGGVDPEREITPEELRSMLDPEQ
jgi:hypothetical protein